MKRHVREGEDGLWYAVDCVAEGCPPHYAYVLGASVPEQVREHANGLVERVADVPPPARAISYQFPWEKESPW